MPDRDDRLHKINFLREGFLVLCDKAGVEIRATDYHSEPLRISWNTLGQWRAGAETPQMTLLFDDSPGGSGPQPDAAATPAPRKTRRQPRRSKRRH